MDELLTFLQKKKDVIEDKGSQDWKRYQEGV